MLINLSEFLLEKDSVKRIELPIETSSYTVAGTIYEIAEKTPIALVITSLEKNKILLECRAHLILKVPCSRCLEDVLTPFDIEVSKEFDFSETDEDRIKELDETNYITGYNLDLDVLIYNEIIIDFPQKVLCKEDCKGICMKCGKNLNKGDCGCDRTVLDPRMSVIQDIFKNFKEV